MNNKKALQFFLLLTCAFTLLTLVGCGQKTVGNTIPEPEITADYLAEEYSQQLMTDGAETIQGNVSIEKDENSYKVHITEKEVVPSESADNGYYIADTNVTKDVSLGFDARIVVEDDGEFTLSDADHFIEVYEEDSENAEAGEAELFTVYLMGDSAELIMPVEPEALMGESE